MLRILESEVKVQGHGQIKYAGNSIEGGSVRYTTSCVELIISSLVCDCIVQRKFTNYFELSYSS